MTRFVTALGILMVLIGLALGFTIWSHGPGESGRDTGDAEAPAHSPRSVGASTLSHGGPAPAGMSERSESRRAVEPFLEPAVRTPRDSSVSQEAESVPPTNRSLQIKGTPRGSGVRGP